MLVPRIKTIASAVTALAVAVMPGRGAVYQNGTDLDQAVARAQPYIAINGGPAVTVETHRSNGTVIDRFSGSLLSSPDGKNRTVATAAHGWLHALAADSNAYAVVLTGRVGPRNHVGTRHSRFTRNKVRKSSLRLGFSWHRAA